LEQASSARFCRTHTKVVRLLPPFGAQLIQSSVPSDGESLATTTQHLTRWLATVQASTIHIRTSLPITPPQYNLPIALRSKGIRHTAISFQLTSRYLHAHLRLALQTPIEDTIKITHGVDTMAIRNDKRYAGSDTVKLTNKGKK
jgi:hypothetical protein